jgi:Alpha/beta hydrolase of unknown function (DUF900)
MNFLIRTHMLSNRVNNADCSAPGPVLYMNNFNFPSQMYNELMPQETLDKTKWIAALADDLFTLYTDKGRPVVLAFYIHGFDLSANDARIAHAWYGSRLFATGLDQGLVVGASWPSNCTSPYYGRQYAEASANLMTAILEAIPLVRAALKAKHGSGAPELVTAVVTHSMGNYLMSTTLASGKVPNYKNAVDWALMLAPDVDYAIFTQNSPVSNQGKAIYEMAKGNVWVFWTWNDEVLKADEYAGNWYVLGYRGPKTPISSATPNVQFVDSGTVATQATGSQYVPYVYGSLAVVHSSYRFVTQLVFWQAFLLRYGRADETLEKVLAASRPDTTAEPGAPSQEPLDVYLYRSLRKSRVGEE